MDRLVPSHQLLGLIAQRRRPIRLNAMSSSSRLKTLATVIRSASSPLLPRRPSRHRHACQLPAAACRWRRSRLQPLSPSSTIAEAQSARDAATSVHRQLAARPQRRLAQHLVQRLGAGLRLSCNVAASRLVPQLPNVAVDRAQALDNGLLPRAARRPARRYVRARRGLLGEPAQRRSVEPASTVSRRSKAGSTSAGSAAPLARLRVHAISSSTTPPPPPAASATLWCDSGRRSLVRSLSVAGAGRAAGHRRRRTVSMPTRAPTTQTASARRLIAITCTRTALPSLVIAKIASPSEGSRSGAMPTTPLGLRNRASG